MGYTLGVEHNTALINPDFEMLAAALGVDYYRLAGDAADILRKAIYGRGTSLVEVRMGESVSFQIRRAAALARKTGRRILRPKLFSRLKHWLKSGSKA